MPARKPLVVALPGERLSVVSHRVLDFNGTLARDGLDLLLQPLRLKATYRR
jgi:hypothetical protein